MKSLSEIKKDNEPKQGKLTGIEIDLRDGDITVEVFKNQWFLDVQVFKDDEVDKTVAFVRQVLTRRKKGEKA